jgi:hypothetical protein
VKTVSPNEQVFVTLRGDTTIEVSLAPGYYERATAAQIEEQLTRTARLVFAERTKAFYDLRSQERGDTVRPGQGAPTPEEAEYKRRRAELAVEGTSDDEAVTISSVGMTHFAVNIAPGTLTRLDSPTFARAVAEAATRLVQDQRSKMLALKLELHGGWATDREPSRAV